MNLVQIEKGEQWENQSDRSNTMSQSHPTILLDKLLDDMFDEVNDKKRPHLSVADEESKKRLCTPDKIVNVHHEKYKSSEVDSAGSSDKENHLPNTNGLVDDARQPNDYSDISGLTRIQKEYESSDVVANDSDGE